MKFTIKTAKKTEVLFLKDNSSLNRLKKNSFKGKNLLVTDEFCLRNFRKEINILKKNFSPCAEFTLKKNPKTFENYKKLMLGMLQLPLNRASCIIALGGGGISDICGFAAASYMRGIKLILVPTTFLGQIDASLGGKNGIDIDGHKNMAGTFFLPDLTIINHSFLKKEELKNSIGEIIKYFLISPQNFSKNKKKSILKILSLDKNEIYNFAGKAVKTKIDIIKKDFEDKKGLRQNLNLGHTAAHAFEKCLKGKISHGEAVLWGLRYAVILSEIMGPLDKKILKEAKELLVLVKPKQDIKKVSFDCFLSAISKDKKNFKEKNRFILFSKNGKLKAVKNIKEEPLLQAFRRLKNEYIGNTRP